MAAVPLPAGEGADGGGRQLEARMGYPEPPFEGALYFLRGGEVALSKRGVGPLARDFEPLPSARNFCESAALCI